MIKCNFCEKEAIGCDDPNFGANYCADHEKKALDILDKYYDHIDKERGHYEKRREMFLVGG